MIRHNSGGHAKERDEPPPRRCAMPRSSRILLPQSRTGEIIKRLSGGIDGWCGVNGLECGRGRITVDPVAVLPQRHQDRPGQLRAGANRLPAAAKDQARVMCRLKMPPSTMSVLPVVDLLRGCAK
jgi:hypothetical protein